MKINRQDTNGVKPLLQVGELGYDNWSGGGDVGRVYVGNGASNIALAKKSEVDVKVVANVDITAGTATKVTYDAKGLVTAGTTLSAGDIPVLDAGKITTGTLPVVRGGTGTTASTGTGNVVLSTSPVLVTPTIGVATGTSFNSITGLSSATPVMDGTATAGTGVTVARADHVHPKDTTKVDANANITAGTYKSVTVDVKGLVTGGTNPTTISGYGITDAYTKAELNAGQLDNRYYTETEIDTLYSTAVKLTGDQTVAGIKTFTSSPIVPVPTTDFQSVPLKSTNITVNVGAGQTYTTINQALEYLSGFYPMYKKSGVTATINLKAGFVMAEQVLVSGIDLGWITITGEDAETIITHTALTTAFYGHYPAFGVDKGGTSPVIGQLFRFNVEKVGGNKHGLMAYGAGSSADILNGKGFIGAGTNGIYAAAGSTTNAINANCSNAGNTGIYANFASTINATNANCSNAGNTGIYADFASTINATNANCSNAGNTGIYAGAGSTINAYSVIIQNQTTGVVRVAVGAGGTINALAINTTGGTVPVFSQAVNTLTANGIIYG